MTSINIREEVETILGRELTKREVSEYRIFWTQITMNPDDLAARIESKK